MKAPQNDSKPRVICPRGSHLSRLVQIIDLGTHKFKPTEDGSRKLYLGFETCNIGHVFKEDRGEEPFMLQIEFNFYMNSANPQKPTKLRQFLVQWFDKDFASEQEARDFDFAKLLNRPAMLTVAHKPKTDGTQKAVIADIFQPTKSDGQGGEVLLTSKEVPPTRNVLVCYEVCNGEDLEFAKMPPFLQKKVKESDEFKRTAGPVEHQQEEPDNGGVDAHGSEHSEEEESGGDDSGLPF